MHLEITQHPCALRNSPQTSQQHMSSYGNLILSTLGFPFSLSGLMLFILVFFIIATFDYLRASGPAHFALFVYCCEAAFIRLIPTFIQGLIFKEKKTFIRHSFKKTIVYTIIYRAF